MDEGEGGVDGLAERRDEGPGSSTSISDGSMILLEVEGEAALESQAGGAVESPMSGM
jgi:hypothetical protein